MSIWASATTSTDHRVIVVLTQFAFQLGNAAQKVKIRDRLALGQGVFHGQNHICTRAERQQIGQRHTIRRGVTRIVCGAHFRGQFIPKILPGQIPAMFDGLTTNGIIGTQF